MLRVLFDNQFTSASFFKLSAITIDAKNPESLKHEKNPWNFGGEIQEIWEHWEFCEEKNKIQITSIIYCACLRNVKDNMFY